MLDVHMLIDRRTAARTRRFSTRSLEECPDGDKEAMAEFFAPLARGRRCGIWGNMVEYRQETR